jgi:ankyrin repeat protein
MYLLLGNTSKKWQKQLVFNLGFWFRALFVVGFFRFGSTRFCFALFFLQAYASTMAQHNEFMMAVLNDEDSFSVPAADFDVNTPIMDGKTALELALRRCKFQSASRLVVLGADVTRPLSTGSNVLLLALQLNGLGFARAILDRAVSDLRLSPSGESCLTWAAFRGADDIVERLVDISDVRHSNKSVRVATLEPIRHFDTHRRRV